MAAALSGGVPLGRRAELAAPGPAGARRNCRRATAAAGDRVPHPSGDSLDMLVGGGGTGPGLLLGLTMHRTLTRREWLAARLARSAASRAARRLRRARRAARRHRRVSIVRAPAYDQSLYDTVRRLLDEHRLDVRGRRVVLKPNLVEFEPESSINTHPLLVHAACEAFRARAPPACASPRARATAATRWTWPTPPATSRSFPRFEDLFVDLNLDEVTRVRPPRQFSRLGKLYLPNTALGADLLVSMPKMKTHHWVGATLSMKNLFGVVPGGVYGWPKNVLHWAGIDECIADLHAAFPAPVRHRGRHRRAWKATVPFRACPSRRACWWRAATRWRWMPPAAASCASILSGSAICGWPAGGCSAHRRAEYPPDRRSHRRRGHAFRPDPRIPMGSDGEQLDASETNSDSALPRHGALAATAARSMRWFRSCCWPRATGSRASQAGDLSSHIYNSWLARLIESGQAQGLEAVRQTTNILFDLMLGGLFRVVGAEAAQRISVSLVVLIFVWGAFAFISAVSGRRAWHLMPCIAMLAYGWVFHMGFFNFYLSLGLCFWALALAWEWKPWRLAAAAPILALAYLAHALPVVWTAGLLAYLWLAGRTAPRTRAWMIAAFAAGHGPVARAGRPHVYRRVVPAADLHDPRARTRVGPSTPSTPWCWWDAAGLGDAVPGIGALLGNAPRGFEHPLPGVRDQRRGGFHPPGCVADPGLSPRPGIHRRAHGAGCGRLRLRPVGSGQAAHVGALRAGRGGADLLRFPVPR